jgi:hypothetical protein
VWALKSGKSTDGCNGNAHMWILNSLLDIPANWNEPAEGEMCAGPEARDHENTDSNYPITDVGAPPKYGRHADLHDSHSDFDDSDPCGFVCLRGYYRGGEFDGSENFAKNFDSVEHRANNYCYRPVRPHVNVVGSEKVTIAASSDPSDLYIDRGAECFDDPLQCGTHDGTDVCDISNLVTVTGNNVNLARIGTYEILYTCRNKAGLEDTATRQVFVEDQKCPTCKFDEPKDSPQITVEASFPYDPNDHLPKCTDDCGFHPAGTEGFEICAKETKDADKHLTTDNVDVEQTGTYYVTYHADDHHNGAGSGKECDQKKYTAVRTVIVVDTMSPIIGLKFDSGSEQWRVHDGKNPAHGDYSAESYSRPTGKIGVNPAVHNFKFMAEVSPANAWMLGAAVVVAATAFVAVSGSAKKTTFVPV